MPSVSHSTIKKIDSGNISEIDDLLAVEEPLEIRLVYGDANSRKQKNISVTMRTPGNDRELAAGFLFTEGIVKNKKDISEIKHTGNNENTVCVELKENVAVDLNKLERHFYTTSSCGVCGKSSIDAIRTLGNSTSKGFPVFSVVKSEIIYKLPLLLREKQNVFESTGGLHASALFDLNGNLILLREDVGRHNALDKLIGAAIEENMLPLDNTILLLSGRASFELIQKAAMAEIKIVAAVGAPSSLAVELAKEFDITLIGFLRDKRFNIYCGEERIIIE
jgi:FdhD protein